MWEAACVPASLGLKRALPGPVVVAALDAAAVERLAAAEQPVSVAPGRLAVAGEPRARHPFVGGAAAALLAFVVLL